MTASRQDLGRAGERLAEAYLRQRGLKTLARRYQTPVGELDLVMRERDTIVFVEVKTRSARSHADPQDNLRPTQQRHIGRCARWYLHHKRLEDAPCRFDVVAIVLPDHGDPDVTYFPHAFHPRGM